MNDFYGVFALVKMVIFLLYFYLIPMQRNLWRFLNENSKNLKYFAVICDETGKPFRFFLYESLFYKCAVSNSQVINIIRNDFLSLNFWPLYGSVYDVWNSLSVIENSIWKWTEAWMIGIFSLKASEKKLFPSFIEDIREILRFYLRLHL